MESPSQIFTSGVPAELLHSIQAIYDEIHSLKRENREIIAILRRLEQHKSTIPGAAASAIAESEFKPVINFSQAVNVLLYLMLCSTQLDTSTAPSIRDSAAALANNVGGCSEQDIHSAISICVAARVMEDQDVSSVRAALEHFAGRFANNLRKGLPQRQTRAEMQPAVIIGAAYVAISGLSDCLRRASSYELNDKVLWASIANMSAHGLASLIGVDDMPACICVLNMEDGDGETTLSRSKAMFRSASCQPSTAAVGEKRKRESACIQ